jgi:hypothetical protein
MIRMTNQTFMICDDRTWPDPGRLTIHRSDPR